MEFNSWKPNLEDEDEPRAHLKFNGQEYLAHRGNSRLYTHMAQLAIYDHIFCSQDNGLGFYVFNMVDGYHEFKEYMLENDFPAYLNQTEVAQCDIDAYDRVIQKSVGDIDHIPDDWITPEN